MKRWPHPAWIVAGILFSGQLAAVVGWHADHVRADACSAAVSTAGQGFSRTASALGANANAWSANAVDDAEGILQWSNEFADQTTMLTNELEEFQAQRQDCQR